MWSREDTKLQMDGFIGSSVQNVDLMQPTRRRVSRRRSDHARELHAVQIVDRNSSHQEHPANFHGAAFGTEIEPRIMPVAKVDRHS